MGKNLPLAISFNFEVPNSAQAVIPIAASWTREGNVYTLLCIRLQSEKQKIRQTEDIGVLTKNLSNS